MHQTQAKLKWYKTTWKWHRNTSISDLVKDSYFGSDTKEMSKPWSETAVIQAYMGNVQKPHVFILHHKEQQFHKSCRRVILMAGI